MQFDLTGKTALITGGSRGIGKACAEIFAAMGATVGITYQRDKRAAETTLASLKSGNHTAWQLTIEEPAATEKFTNDFIEKHGRIDILVNNAGVYFEHKITGVSFDEWTASWKKTLAVNLEGPANLCYFASKQMIKHGGGKIINISSRGAFRGEPDCPAYGASKAGLNAMSQSLAQALAPHNISVHVIAPGFVETDMAAHVLDGPQGEAIKKQSPFGRVARPEEVARMVALCALDGVEFSSGAIIDINGASYLRS
jgi:NAD(P)-dependent dehydrogenase (short-subunit alcohol dehydrogenase family)